MRVSGDDALARLVEILAQAKRGQLEPVAIERAQTSSSDPLSRLDALIEQARSLVQPLLLETLVSNASADGSGDGAALLGLSGQPDPLAALSRQLKQEIAQVGGSKSITRLPSAEQSKVVSVDAAPRKRVDAPLEASAGADASRGASDVLWRVLGQRSLSGASRASAAALLSEVLSSRDDERLVRALYLLVHDQEP